LTLHESGIDDAICKKLSLDVGQADLGEWESTVNRAVAQHERSIKVGIVAKYLDNADTYLCVFEALKAAAWWNDVNIDISWIDAVKLAQEGEADKTLGEYDGIVVPGGFGSRGVEGKVKAAQYALTKKLPYIGLCYGLQMGVIAAARLNGLEDANTTEVDPNTKNPVINTMVDQKGKEKTGGTMRLGDYKCHLEPDSLSAKLYGQTDIVERHRHRFECNSEYVDQYQKWGIRAVGRNPETNLVEVIEAIDHPFFVASQYHPEFKSRPNRPHPLFDGFVKSMLQKS
jgi:CTP synthase